MADYRTLAGNDADGTGLGFAIVGAVADAHGWDVRLTGRGGRCGSSSYSSST
jgi:signal transduction histidine kinase